MRASEGESERKGCSYDNSLITPHKKLFSPYNGLIPTPETAITLRSQSKEKGFCSTDYATRDNWLRLGRDIDYLKYEVMLRSNEQFNDTTTLTETKNGDYLKYKEKYLGKHEDKLRSVEEWARSFRGQYKDSKANYCEDVKKLDELEYDRYGDYNKLYRGTSSEPYKSHLYQELITNRSNRFIGNKEIDSYPIHMRDQRYASYLRKNSLEHIRKRDYGEDNQLIASLRNSYRGPVYYDEELSLNGRNIDLKTDRYINNRDAYMRELANIRDGLYTRREPLDPIRYDERRYLSAASFGDRDGVYDFNRRVLEEKSTGIPLNNAHREAYDPELFKFSIERRGEMLSPLEYERLPYRSEDVIRKEYHGRPNKNNLLPRNIEESANEYAVKSPLPLNVTGKRTDDTEYLGRASLYSKPNESQNVINSHEQPIEDNKKMPYRRIVEHHNRPIANQLDEASYNPEGEYHRPQFTLGSSGRKEIKDERGSKPVNVETPLEVLKRLNAEVRSRFKGDEQPFTIESEPQDNKHYSGLPEASSKSSKYELEQKDGKPIEDEAKFEMSRKGKGIKGPFEDEGKQDDSNSNKAYNNEENMKHEPEYIKSHTADKEPIIERSIHTTEKPNAIDSHLGIPNKKKYDEQITEYNKKPLVSSEKYIEHPLITKPEDISAQSLKKKRHKGLRLKSVKEPSSEKKASNKKIGRPMIAKNKYKPLLLKKRKTLVATLTKRPKDKSTSNASVNKIELQLDDHCWKCFGKGLIKKAEAPKGE